MSNKKSTTNVPASASTPSKKATNKAQPVHNQPKSNAALMNGKHHQVPVKKQVHSGNAREHSPERTQNHSTAQKGSLMELLFAASEKQRVQQKEPSTQLNQRSRKSTAPSVVSSSAYAGAAFDRAPTGESFPVPSFLSKTSLADDESLFSVSCPLPSGPMASRASKDTKPVSVNSSPLSQPAAKNPVLKSVSIQDLLGPTSQPSTPSKSTPQAPSSSPSPPSKAISVSSKPAKSKSTEKKKELNLLTEDLRRMLNITK